MLSKFENKVGYFINEDSRFFLMFCAVVFQLCQQGIKKIFWLYLSDCLNEICTAIPAYDIFHPLT